MATLTRIQMAMHLQSLDLFAFCTAEQVMRMASIARQRRFAAGDVIFHADDANESLFCVIEGQVTLSCDEGERQVHAPGTIGVREILSGYSRSETATAVSETLVLAFDGEDLFDLLSNNIEIVKALFRKLLRPS